MPGLGRKMAVEPGHQDGGFAAMLLAKLRPAILLPRPGIFSIISKYRYSTVKQLLNN